MSHYGPSGASRGESRSNGCGGRWSSAVDNHGWGNQRGRGGNKRGQYRQSNYDQRRGDYRHSPNKKSRWQGHEYHNDRRGGDGGDSRGGRAEDSFSKSSSSNVREEEIMSRQELSFLRQERNRSYPHKGITKEEFLKLSKDDQILAMVSSSTNVSGSGLILSLFLYQSILILVLQMASIP